jgi:hypothetical protein
MPSASTLTELAAAGLAGLAGLALALAGCGGSSVPGVAHLSSGKGAAAVGTEGGGSSREGKMSTQQKLVVYAQCMRTHGEPDFPEPVEGHIVTNGGVGNSQNPGSAQFQAAERQCRKLLPSGGTVSPQMQKQAEERALKFAGCMRSHGEPNFPTPEFHNSGGGFQITISGPHSGIDPGSPQFKAAAKYCRQYFGPPGSKGGAAAAQGSAAQGGAP